MQDLKLITLIFAVTCAFVPLLFIKRADTVEEVIACRDVSIAGLILTAAGLVMHGVGL